MSENQEKKPLFEKFTNTNQMNELLGRLFTAVRPEAIYSPPVTQGNNTVITASEIVVGFGAGSGGGAGPDGEGGGGGGGGGTALGRPIAVIIMTPDRVQVEPIVDISKLAIALFTTLGAIFLMLSRLHRQSQ